MAVATQTLLEVRDLRVQFGSVCAVDGISFSIAEGETLALVGESGSGKSVTALALARLLSPVQARTHGAVSFAGRDISGLGDDELRGLRGRDIAYVFQEPGSALNPVFTVGYQVEEALRLHKGDTGILPVDAQAGSLCHTFREQAVQWLGKVGIPDPDRRYSDYPHQFSGGMQQRVMIAMALACRPRLLVADEPTTALDVTVQEQILKLLSSLQRELGMAMLLITHNLGIVAGIADRVCVMKAGQIVETGPVESILRNPKHPYTQALLAAVPRLK
jgi:ABC-type dipeptide/oligopeptide/nickel transport system ATPase component